MARRLRRERPPESLSATALSVLSHLYRQGSSTPGEIAAAEHQKAQSLTRVFAELQLEGLISRQRSERDGRESVLSLTRAGSRALAQDMRARDQWLQAALATLGETEIDVLLIAARILDRLSEAAPDQSDLSDVSGSHSGGGRAGSRPDDHRALGADEEHGAANLVVGDHFPRPADAFRYLDEVRSLLSGDFDEQRAVRGEPAGRFEDDATQQVEPVRAAIQRTARFVVAGFGWHQRDVLGRDVRRIGHDLIEAAAKLWWQRLVQVSDKGLATDRSKVAMRTTDRGRLDVCGVHVRRP